MSLKSQQKIYGRGILRIIKDDYGEGYYGIYVNLSHLCQMKSKESCRKILDYWHSQGFAEAEDLPYQFIDGYLIVTQDLHGYGFLKGSGTLDEEVYNIPF